MLCSEVMRRFVLAVRPDDTAQTAARRMREETLGIMPVCEADGRVVGVVTDRDLAIRLCAEDLRASVTTVGEVMTQNVIACRSTDRIDEAEAAMREHRITRILVTDEAGTLCGILSLSDLVFYEPSARVGRTLRAIAERKYIPRSGP